MSEHPQIMHLKISGADGEFLPQETVKRYGIGSGRESADGVNWREVDYEVSEIELIVRGVKHNRKA